MNRARKVIGKHKNSFNIKIEGSDLERSVKLEALERRRTADEEKSQYCHDSQSSG